MAKISIFEVNDKVVFNKIENYRDQIESAHLSPIVSENTVNYKDQKNELIGTIVSVNVSNHIYTIQYEPMNMRGTTSTSVLLNVKFDEVKGLHII